jgi:hypothetical protein
VLGRDPVGHRAGLVEIADTGSARRGRQATLLDDRAPRHRRQQPRDRRLHALDEGRVGQVSRIACASSSCSACENRSIAIQSGSVLPSQITRISLGPAIMSMPTTPNTRRLAAAT